MSSAHAFGREACHDACSTRDIQNPLACAWGSPPDEVSGPERRDRRDEVALVEFGGGALELPGLMLGHVAILLSQWHRSLPVRGAIPILLFSQASVARSVPEAGLPSAP